MFYAVLICTDESCAEEFEAWGELEDFEVLACAGCGCTLQALSWSDVSRGTIVAFPTHAERVERMELGLIAARRGDRAA
jgi:hypothetical protein